jgi:hypothetical protein
MTIHVRLRPGQDDDIASWYETQPDKSQLVRQAIRFYIKSQNVDNLENIVQQVVAQELTQLPTLVSAAVREALEDFQLTPIGTGRHPLTDEDPEQAARLDEQLSAFFEQ